MPMCLLPCVMQCVGLKFCLPAGRQTSTGTPGVDFATNNPTKVKTQVCYGTSATTLTSFVAAETEVRCQERWRGLVLMELTVAKASCHTVCSTPSLSGP
jgi:hypothetical protein